MARTLLNTCASSRTVGIIPQLTACIKHNNADLMSAILKKFPSKKNLDGKLLIHTALSTKKYKFVEILLNECGINILENVDITPFLFWCMEYQKEDKMLILCLSRGVLRFDCKRIIHTAIQKGYWWVINMLLSYYPELVVKHKDIMELLCLSVKANAHGTVFLAIEILKPDERRNVPIQSLIDIAVSKKENKYTLDILLIRFPSDFIKSNVNTNKLLYVCTKYDFDEQIKLILKIVGTNFDAVLIIKTAVQARSFLVLKVLLQYDHQQLKIADVEELLQVCTQYDKPWAIKYVLQKFRSEITVFHLKSIIDIALNHRSSSVLVMLGECDLFFNYLLLIASAIQSF